MRRAGVCDNLVNAFKLQANQQEGGDSLVELVVGGLQERSRCKMMEELRKFISMDIHEAVKIEALEKAQESRMWETVDGSHRSWMRTGMPVCHAIQQGRRGIGMGGHALQVRGTAQIDQPWTNKKARAPDCMFEGSHFFMDCSNFKP